VTIQDSLPAFLRKSSPRVLYGGLAGVVVLALVVILVFLPGGESQGSGETVVAERRVFASSIVAIGAVKPRIGAEVRVGSRIPGRVERLEANIGDRVARGDVIARLEPAEYDALVAQRQAELRVAQGRLAALEALDPGEVARAEAELSRWEATARRAAEEWERFRTLLETGSVARSEADAAEERHLVAAAQREEARNTLELLRRGNAEARLQGRAEVDRAQAAATAAEVERSFTVLRSPIDGVVASVATQEGETVAAGLSAPTFVTIVDLDRLQVDAYVDEVDIGRVEVGQRVVFSVDAYPAMDFEGEVEAIYPTATIQDNVVKYVAAVGITSSYGGFLRPEMTTNVRILLESREALAVPAAAIRREGGRTVVYVQGSGGPEAREVRVGWREGAWAEIVEGVQLGQRIYLEPPQTEGTR
jgi:multidrug resistance efflux pump